MAKKIKYGNSDVLVDYAIKDAKGNIIYDTYVKNGDLAKADFDVALGDGLTLSDDDVLDVNTDNIASVSALENEKSEREEGDESLLADYQAVNQRLNETDVDIILADHETIECENWDGAEMEYVAENTLTMYVETWEEL